MAWKNGELTVILLWYRIGRSFKPWVNFWPVYKSRSIFWTDFVSMKGWLIHCRQNAIITNSSYRISLKRFLNCASSWPPTWNEEIWKELRFLKNSPYRMGSSKANQKMKFSSFNTNHTLLHRITTQFIIEDHSQGGCSSLFILCKEKHSKMNYLWLNQWVTKVLFKIIGS